MTNFFGKTSGGLSPQELTMLLNLFAKSSLKYSVDDTLKGSLESLKEKGLLQPIGVLPEGAGISASEVGELTDKGVDALLDNIPLPTPEILGDDVRVLLELISQTTTKVRQVETTVEAVKRLLDGGYLKALSESDNPLEQIEKDIPLDDIVELTKLGARLFGLRKKTDRVKLDVPLIFPMKLTIHSDEESLPMPVMPRIHGSSYKISLDVSEDTLEGLGFDSPFKGRKWRAVMVMYDPDKEEQKLFTRTNFFSETIEETGKLLDTPVRGKAFSLFLIPTRDNSAFEILKEGEGTLREFHDDQRFGEILDKAIELSGKVKGASAMDLNSNIGKALLKEIDVDPDADAEELVKQLSEVYDKLQNGKLPKAIQSGANQVAFNLLKGVLGASGLATLGIVTTVFKAFRFLYDLEHKHYFELMELEAEVENGVTLLKVKPEDVTRIRLDENSEGPKGKDLRHILVYRYRPIVEKSTELGVILNDGRPTLALMDRSEAKKDQIVRVPGDEKLEFDPSLTLSLVHLTADLEFVSGGSEVCPVQFDPETGQVHLSDLNRIFHVEQRKPWGYFRTKIGFDQIESPQIQLVPGE